MGLDDDVLSRLILSADARVVFKERRDKGTSGQEEVFSYDVLDVNGVSIGTVAYTEHVNLNGFRQTYRLVQRDSKGTVIVNVGW